MSSEPGRRRWLDLIEIFAVGLPFCAFKLIAGGYLISATKFGVVGVVLVGLGVVDAALNLINAVTVMAMRRRRLPVCLLQGAVMLTSRTPRALNVGTALDTLLSFTLVASMIGFGALGSMKSEWASSWNVAVILNVLGAGALRLMQALAEPEVR